MGKEIFDTAVTKAAIVRGRRCKWIERKGGKATGFKYFDCRGKLISDEDTLDRIKSLVIPPAWRHVRICPSKSGRLQVVGMDTRGRIQYRYHPSFSRQQEKKKFSKMAKFGECLPALREKTNEHLALDGLPKEKVLAVMLRLINSLYFRVGTELSEKHYKTYGITTLDRKHLSIKRMGRLEFAFVGKSHVEHRKILVDEELAAVVKEIASLPRGRKLFRYIDDGGRPRTLKPADINRYIKQSTDPMFSSKDFRTWGGTLLAALELADIGPPNSESEAKKNLVRAVKAVARELGNTPSVCRASYIHPAVLDHYIKGKTLSEFTPRGSRGIRKQEAGLKPEETALLNLLRSS